MRLADELKSGAIGWNYFFRQPYGKGAFIGMRGKNLHHVLKRGKA
jgi:hypothetical protein